MGLKIGRILEAVSFTLGNFSRPRLGFPTTANLDITLLFVILICCCQDQVQLDSTRDVTMTDQERRGILEPHLSRLLSSRTHPKTICPSEVPRALSSAELQEAGASSWRDLMDCARAIVWELRDRNEVEILQKGEVLASNTRLEDVSGPIRVRKKI